MDEFSDRGFFPRSDFTSDAGLLTNVMAALNKWAIDRGFVAALPSYYCLARPDEPFEHEILLLQSNHAKRDTIPITELGDLNDVASVFRRTHAWAVKKGFLSGVPEFHLRGKKLECVLIRPESAELIEISAEELSTFLAATDSLIRSWQRTSNE